MSAVLRVKPDAIAMWCPGCDDVHRIPVGLPNGWTWDGDENTPTVSPSILVRAVQWDESSGFHRPNHQGVAVGAETRCHSFLRAGIWEFQGDCTHTLAGQHVPMVPLPDPLAED